MTRSRLYVLAAGLVLVVTLSACAKKAPAPAPPPPPPPPTAPAPPPPPPPPPPPAPAPAPAPLTEDELFARKSLDQLNAEKPLDDVFFAYDSFDLSDTARTSLSKNAQWLKRWPTTKIMIEGHCDNRGTPEYNLGLGEKRATAVRNYVTSLGIAMDRITIVSKGEEAPFCREDTEACWSQNRRGHFLFTAK
jgi:peptidoglycan-associated lipoprotein